MDKPFPPWKYWTASSIRGTLHKVLTDIGEEVKENVARIVETHDAVDRTTSVDYLIKNDFTESALVVEFSLKEPQSKRPDLEKEVGKMQFDILQEVSKYLVTSKVKPHLKMTTNAQGKRFTSVTKWEHIVEISKKEISFKDWKEGISLK